jgi:pyruvate dehydrogenase E2 component (dihydrolipoamide acetyltransferase)
MASEVVMPRMGLTMDEGTLVGWRKAEGQKVVAGEPLFEIETDKSTVEVEAAESGVLGKILFPVGATVPVGTVIALMVKEGEAVSENGTLAAERINPDPVAARSGSGLTPETSPTINTSSMIAGKVKASPAARRLAIKLGVDLRQTSGSGPGGRIVAWNVRSQGSKTPILITPVAARAAANLGTNLSSVQGSGPGGRITRQDVEQAHLSPVTKPTDISPEQPTGTIRPFTRIEQVMAGRMVESFTSAPHFYLHVSIDARPLVSLREQLKGRLEKRSGIHLTYTDLLVFFCARVLARHPEVMSQWTFQGMRMLNEVHVGVAVDTPAGLLVPVIRNADRLGLTEISRELANLSSRSRSGSLLPVDQELGVFTISNLGAFGIDAFDAVLNPPQAALLTVGRIKEQAMVDAGKVVAAAMLTLSLSVDHRVLDGARAARFMGELAELLETPALSFE